MERGASAHERRASPRIEVGLLVQLTRKLGAPLAVRTLDVGPGGARIASARPLRIDEELSFDFDLPDGSCHVTGRARVLRQQQHEVYALRFERLGADDACSLQAWAGAAAEL
jgi:hypothetical protein